MSRKGTYQEVSVEYLDVDIREKSNEPFDSYNKKDTRNSLIFLLRRTKIIIKRHEERLQMKVEKVKNE